jgi:hypothetical protein
MSGAPFEIGPRREAYSYLTLNGGERETRMRQINGVDYAFVRINYADGSVSLMASPAVFDTEASWHWWKIGPDGWLA